MGFENWDYTKYETLSPSQLSTWNECEVKWKLRYVEQLLPKTQKQVFFEKGSYIHELLHYYYALINSGYAVGNDILLTAVVDRIKTDIDKSLETDQVDTKFFRDVIKTMTNYITVQSPRIDKKLIDPRIEAHLEYTQDGRRFHGFVDLMYKKIKNGKEVWVIRDHKSGSSNSWKDEKVKRDPQLLFYGALWYMMMGEVADVEISFLHSKPPTNPKSQSTLFGLYSISHTAKEYENFWDYLLRINKKQQSLQVEHNYNACTYCAYYPVCRADLRGYSVKNIIEGNYYHGNRPIPKENPGGDITFKKSLGLDFR